MIKDSSLTQYNFSYPKQEKGFTFAFNQDCQNT